MLLIKYKLKENQYGIGVYADEFIPKGTLVGKFFPEFDKVLHEEDIINSPEQIKKYFIDHAYKDKFLNIYVLNTDGGAYVNHSFTPNVETTSNGIYASENIEIDEEILINYNSFEVYPDKDNILHVLCEVDNFDINYRKSL